MRLKLRKVRTFPEARILTLTNMWPDEERPVYGIFVKRQVDSLEAELGIVSDVWYVPGHVSKLAYLLAAYQVAVNRRTISERYDLIHVHAGETSIACWFTKLPKVVSFCGDDLLGRRDSSGRIRPLHRLQRWINRALAACFDSIIVKSEEMKNALPSQLVDRASVIPNGVNTDLFRPISRAEARRKLGWPAGLRALFVATHPHDPRKRLWLAEEACTVASKILGETLELVVTENVDPSQMPWLMNGADLLLHTSLLEGSPNAVKEALACNLPVVATDSGDISALLCGVQPGIVSEENAESIGTAAAAALNSRQRSNGSLAMSYLGEDVVANNICRVYASTTGKSFYTRRV